jgi:hypothetical protein
MNRDGRTVNRKVGITLRKGLRLFVVPSVI